MRNDTRSSAEVNQDWSFPSNLGEMIGGERSEITTRRCFLILIPDETPETEAKSAYDRVAGRLGNVTGTLQIDDLLASSLDSGQRQNRFRPERREAFCDY